MASRGSLEDRNFDSRSLFFFCFDELIVPLKRGKWVVGCQRTRVKEKHKVKIRWTKRFTRNKPAVPQSRSYRPEIYLFSKKYYSVLSAFCSQQRWPSFYCLVFFHCRHLSNRLVYEIFAVAIKESHCAQNLTFVFLMKKYRWSKIWFSRKHILLIKTNEMS